MVNIFTIVESSQESRVFSHERFKEFNDLYINPDDYKITELIFKDLKWNEHTKKWSLVFFNKDIIWDNRYIDIDECSTKLFYTKEEAEIKANEVLNNK